MSAPIQELKEDVIVDVSTKAADIFTESFYGALNSVNGRANITDFYVKPTAAHPAEADICMNGTTYTSPAKLKELFAKQFENVLYEDQDVDAQMINPNYNVGAEDSNLGFDESGKKMSIMVIVSGSVTFSKDGNKGMTRGFTETFVLVPNWEAHRPNAAKGMKQWLIQSQNFRMIL